jgi:DNA-binding HxlR family transcriptional regulator
MATYSLHRKFTCPVELALEVLNGKWKTVILAHLKQGSLRYGELRFLIPSLSDKVLSERLRDLEDLGLIVRHKGGGRGSPSRYALTRRGRTLSPVLQGLYDWGESIAGEVGATIETAEQRRSTGS